MVAHKWMLIPLIIEGALMSLLVVVVVIDFDVAVCGG